MSKDLEKYKYDNRPTKKLQYAIAFLIELGFIRSSILRNLGRFILIGLVTAIILGWVPMMYAAPIVFLFFMAHVHKELRIQESGKSTYWVVMVTLIFICGGMYWFFILHDANEKQLKLVRQKDSVNSLSDGFAILSDEFDVTIGGLTQGYTRAELEEAKRKPLDLGGIIPFNIYLDNGKLFTDVNVWGGANMPAIRLIHNKLDGLPRDWDMNSNERAMEIVDDKDSAIYQFIYLKDNHIAVRGTFPTPSGVVYADEWQFEYGHNTKSIHLTRIFKYPSWKYPRELDTTQHPKPKPTESANWSFVDRTVSKEKIPFAREILSRYAGDTVYIFFQKDVPDGYTFSHEMFSIFLSAGWNSPFNLRFTSMLDPKDKVQGIVVSVKTEVYNNRLIDIAKVFNWLGYHPRTYIFAHQPYNIQILFGSKENETETTK